MTTTIKIVSGLALIVIAIEFIHVFQVRQSRKIWEKLNRHQEQ